MKLSSFLRIGALWASLLLNGLLPAQSISISPAGAPPDGSAALDIQASDKGLLIPRLSSAQRQAIASPATGLMVYDTDSDGFWYHDGVDWRELGLGGLLAQPGTVVIRNLRDDTGMAALGYEFLREIPGEAVAWDPISEVGAPSPREDHSSVWTGSEWIIWGGAGPNGELADGARYDPGTDTWTPISPLNAPPARRNHVACWTGAEMIIWGGEAASTPLATGARYNPAADTWTPMSALGSPGLRSQPAIGWTGTVMVVWGGVSSGGFLNTGVAYDPAADAWTPIATVGAPSARAAATALWTGSVLLIWGGYSIGASFPPNFVYPVSGARYDPGNNSWTSMGTANAPIGREGHTATLTDRGMMIWGGRQQSLSGAGSAPAAGGFYDPIPNAWTTLPADGAAAPTFGHRLVNTGATAVLTGPFLPSVGAILELANLDWESLAIPNGPTSLSGHSADWTGNEMLFWGGRNSSGLSAAGFRLTERSTSLYFYVKL